MLATTHSSSFSLLPRFIGARPFGPLDAPEPDDEPTPELPRYVDLDPWRGRGVFAEVLAAIRRFVVTGTHSSVQLLAGGRGTGKSTELRRIAHALEHGHTVDDALRESVVVLPVDLARHGAWMRPPTAQALRSKLAVELREAARLRLGRWELPASSDPHEVVAALVDQLAPRRLVLLVDHFDALAVPPWEVARAYAQLDEALVGASRGFTSPGCLTLYVVSDHMALVDPSTDPDTALLSADEVWFLPAVRVWNERGGLGVEDEAVHRLEQVVAGWVDLDALLGRHRAELVRRLVILGGGNLGVLGRLVAEVLHLADERRGLPVTALELVDAATRLRARMQLCTDACELLARARDVGPQALITQADAGLFVEAMHHGALQNYWGGLRGETLWQDLHPLVVPGRLWA